MTKYYIKRKDGSIYNIRYKVLQKGLDIDCIVDTWEQAKKVVNILLRLNSWTLTIESVIID